MKPKAIRALVDALLTQPPTPERLKQLEALGLSQADRRRCVLLAARKEAKRRRKAACLTHPTR